MKQNPIDHDCDVLVVGAGPAGLTLACALAARGVRVIILDRQTAGANTSRAAVVHARTLETLEQISVTERLKQLGIRCSTFAIRDRDSSLMSLDLSTLPTRYPYTLMIPQNVTEGVLVERLRELGVEVTRPRTLVSFTQNDATVEGVLDDGSSLKARYMVGADGMHSKVRELAGIAFEGARYEESFVLADVRLSGGIPRDEVILYFSPQGLVVAAPLPNGAHRIVATVNEAPENPTIDDIQGLLDNRGPVRDRAIVEDLIWSSRFRVHHRIADRYRSGRVLLAGDAAHVHSPAGGQGMNISIQDGMALAGYLVTALHSGDPKVLDQYTAKRRPIADGVISLTDRLTRLATVSRALTPLRNFLIRMVGSSARFRTKLALRLAGLAAEGGPRREFLSDAVYRPRM